METELFPCLVEMKFLGVKVDVQKAHTMKQELSQQEAKLIQDSKKRNRNRHSNMGCKIDRTSVR